MARGFTDEAIKSPGIYEVQLIDRDNGELVETRQIEVFILAELKDLCYNDWIHPGTFTSLDNLYRDYKIRHRKLRASKSPISFFSEELSKKWRKTKEKIRLKEIEDYDSWES